MISRSYKLSNDNTLTVKIGEIEKQQGDVLVCWSAINLKGGPSSFYKIHKKAGPQLSYAALSFEPMAKEGDAFSTIPGFLDFNLVIHAIVPSQPQLYNKAMFNIFNTCITYKQKNIVRNITFDSPHNNHADIIKNLFTYKDQISKCEFIYIVADEHQLNRVDKIVTSSVPIKQTLFNRIIDKLFHPIKLVK